MRISNHIAWVLDEKEGLLVNYSTMKAVTLNETSSLIIEKISQGIKIEVIIEDIARLFFQTSKEEIKNDIQELVEKLKEIGYLTDDEV